MNVLGISVCFYTLMFNGAVNEKFQLLPTMADT